jgi:hypothetical protein
VPKLLDETKQRILYRVVRVFDAFQIDLVEYIEYRITDRVFSVEIFQIKNLDENVIALQRMIISDLLQMFHKMKLTETQ